MSSQSAPYRHGHQQQDQDLRGAERDDEAVARSQRVRRREHRLNPALAGTLGQAQILLEQDREADRGDQRRLRARMAERPEHHALDHEAMRRTARRGGEQHQQQGQRQRGHIEHGQDRDAEEGRVGADHRDLAERQVDPADDAVDQRVADREQAVDAPERGGMDAKLQEVEELAHRPRAGRVFLARPGLGLVAPEPVLRAACRALPARARPAGRCSRP